MIRGNVNYNLVRENIRRVIEDQNVSLRQFALKAGLDPSNFTRKLKGEQTITDRDIIKLKGSNINPAFLLTGEGDMYLEENIESEKAQGLSYVIQFPAGIPVYEEEFACGILKFGNPDLKPVGYAELPGTKGATCWCKATGHSMEPLIEHGDYVCLKKVNDWKNFIMYGDVYGIETVNDICAIKRIEKGERPEEYNLVSVNESYQPQPIKTSLITALFRVIAVTKML